MSATPYLPSVKGSCRYGLRDAVSIEWAAGYFEGEGCITLNWQPTRKDGSKRAYLLLSLGQHKRDRDVLENFAQVVGVGNISGPFPGGMLQWTVNGKRALQFLSDHPEFVSRLGARRQARIQECLNQISNQPPPLTPSEAGKFGGRPRVR